MIDAREFLSVVDAQEISDPERSLASKNIEVLTNTKVKEVLASNPETAWDYWNSLSLALFHEAQHQLQEGSSGKEMLAQALEAASNMDLDGDEDWVTYLKATQAYANGDLALLEKLAGSISNERNAIVANNLVDGLKTRGSSDYIQDYNKA
ncbi:hypothetical protein HQ524_02830 [Candidatus Uhrbacteria bacterium]|nr:hypothetical protein [Candidatus Uhrbacteria bacterium]